MKKVAVLGVLGMAGHIMAEYLDSSGDYEVLGIARTNGRYVTDQIDALDFEGVEKFLNEMMPDVIINCIGTLVQQSKNDISTAILINSYLPHFLSELANKIDARLIHISTDCVFSGKIGGYVENAFMDGDDNYGRTKALGEVINDKDLTIRTSIIGPELKENSTGLMDWFFKQSGEIKGFTQAYWSGVTTLELAKATDQMIKQNITGLFQLCPVKKISKYDLLFLFQETWSKKLIIIPSNDYAVDKSLVCTRNDFKYTRPSYHKMLLELKRWIEDHPTYYSINYG